MTFVYEEHTEAEGWTSQGQFKTLRGATSRGCKRQRTSGYLHRDKHDGDPHVPGYRRHIVAEWQDARGKVVARVWC